VVLDGAAHRVVAIAPVALRYPADSAYYLPTWLPGSKSERGHSFLSVVARLEPGATMQQGDAALERINAALAEQYPDEHARLGATIVGLADFLNGTLREPLSILMGASALVLLIACANLANLLLARGNQRQRELTVRAALGADRGKLLRVVLSEALVIAAAGALLGVMLAAGAVRLLLATAPTVLPSHADPGVDVIVVVIGTAASVLTVLLFALWPAWRAAQAAPGGALQDESRGSTAGRGRASARGMLVAFEVALSLTLLAGAGLLIESLRRVADVDVGFDPAHAVVATILLQPPVTSGQDPDEAWLRNTEWAAARLAPMAERLRALPGVERVAFTDSVPMGRGSSTKSPVAIIGQDPAGAGEGQPWAMWRFASPDYASALGIPLRRGRFLDTRDGQAGAWPIGIVVNQSFADRYLGTADPIGRQIDLLGAEPQTIVGVVADTRLFGREEQIPPEVYMPITSMPSHEYQVVLQVSGDPATYVEPVRRSLRDSDIGMPVVDVRTLQEVVDGGGEQRSFNLQLMMVFSGVALALAALGIYAVIAYAVAQRRQEFGIRMSLGATSGRVVGLVLGQGMRMVAAGVLVGLGGAYAIGRVLSSQLFAVDSADPRVIGAVTLLLCVVALAACCIPALRAARTPPMLALR
jgi:predicted permease